MSDLKSALESASRIPETSGIGTLGEHTLHSAMKFYFEPDGTHHEIKLGRSYADILRDGRIFEVQTRSLYKLVPKLRSFLEEYEVTVVLPVARKKRIVWVDEEQKSVSAPRKSPKTGKLTDALPELYGIRDFISHERFSLICVVFDGDEYREKNRFDVSRRGTVRLDVVPTQIVDEVFFGCPDDYRAVFAVGEGEFTASRFEKETGMRGIKAWRALKFLCACGAVLSDGKRGREYVYSWNNGKKQV